MHHHFGCSRSVELKRTEPNMIKLFSLKQQKKDGEATPKTGTQKKASAAQLRITKGKKWVTCSGRCGQTVFLLSDINELNLPKTCTTEFPDPDDLLNFKLIICPDEVNKEFCYLALPLQGCL